MTLELSYKRYQLDIPQSIWVEFFAQFTDEHRGYPLTLKLRDPQLGDWELLRHKPFFAIAYDRSDIDNNLVITVSQSLETPEVAYAHRVVYPQAVTIVTDDDGRILSCTVTDSDQAQTIINFSKRADLAF
ncbi:DUF5335 family protein [Nodosilinea sp. LEGE 07088]|uniref:DUF5335 family protein n=1 Tax=Nodosilinea sp. LEGE 07088 TaxID=2777968 RepID=UPI0018811B29|nr:DUF5335 family protein [Nodosilinea sp. LEGE 07088]MBE9138164.1 DUF5335 family protein [Nodosilinea sp. LEGE 07088]